MNVKELIELLQELPEDSVVVLSKDGEGNSYSPWSGYSTGVYWPESTWEGSFITSDDGEYYDDALEEPSVVPCVVLWPTN